MLISGLRHVEKMFEEGRLRAALSALGGAEPADTGLKIAFAEALDEVGDSDRARVLLDRILANPDTTPSVRATALRVLAAVLLNLGSPTAAAESLSESLATAESQGLVEEAAHASLWLFSLHYNLHGPGGASPYLSLAKKYVLRSGSQRLLAELHSRVGQADAQASHYLSARRHLSLALELLESHPHLGNRARAHLALSSTCALVADNERGMAAAKAALLAAEGSGSLRLILLCKANLAQLQLRADELDEALNNAKAVLCQISLVNPLRLAVLETLVASCLEGGRREEFQAEIEEFDELMKSADNSWVSVEAVPTFVRLLLERGMPQKALDVLALGIERSSGRSNKSSATRLALLKAEVLALGRQPLEALKELDSARLLWNDDCSADILATGERIMGVLSHWDGARRLSRQHFARAERVFRRCGLRLEARRTRAIKKIVTAQTSIESTLSRHAGQLETSSGIAFLCRLTAYPTILAAEVCRFVQEQRLGHALTLGGRIRMNAMPGGNQIDVGSDGDKDLVVCVHSRPTARESQILASTEEALRHAVLLRKVTERTEQLQHFWDSEPSVDAVHGLFISSEMKGLLKSAHLFARTDLPILILGETGTGKEILAAEIHAASKRAKQAFIPFNVTAVSRDLIESQLFGAKKGAFTGATHDTKGLLREAEGGTIFLDEIGEMSLDVQPKLLRFVEQGEIQPVGERPQHVDVRIIAATNASLQELVRLGRFREDLFHRLRVVPLTIPPLRDRREEIPALTRHFITKHAGTAKRPVPDISPRALERLVAADWPGNVRQLTNELKRVVALLPESATIEIEHLSEELQRPPVPQPLSFDSPTGRMTVNLDRPLDLVLEEVERATLERVMTVCSGNQSEAARRLGVTRKGLYLKLKRLGLAPD